MLTSSFSSGNRKKKNAEKKEKKERFTEITLQIGEKSRKSMFSVEMKGWGETTENKSYNEKENRNKDRKERKKSTGGKEKENKIIL